MINKKITKFSRQSCGPCVAFAAAWKELKEENPEIEFVEVDTGTEGGKKEAQDLGIRKIPYYVNQDGAKIVGETTKEAFQQILLK